MARKYLTEMLQEINDNPKAIKDYKDNNAMKLLFKHAFDARHEFVLPDGNPPFKQEKSPLGLSPVNIVSQLRKLYVFTRSDIQDIRREAMFISLLESIHPQEAEILIAVKDQDLERLYPNITFEKVKKAGLIEPDAKKPKKKASKESTSKKTKASKVTKKKTKAKKKVSKKKTSKRVSKKTQPKPSAEEIEKNKMVDEGSPTKDNADLIRDERDQEILKTIFEQAKDENSNEKSNTDSEVPGESGSNEYF